MAHWRSVAADRAGAAAILAAAEATADGLDHLHAGFVFGLAANADAVGRHFACAVAASEIAFANRRAVPSATNAAQADGESAAEILERLASGLVVAATVDLAAILALFNADFALLDHAVGRIGHGAHRGFDVGWLLGRARLAL